MNAPVVPRVGVLLVAAGRGRRAMQSREDLPKQYRLLQGQMVLARTLGAFLNHPLIDHVAVTIHGDDQSLYEAACGQVRARRDRLLPPVLGGESRQDSVFRGLMALASITPDLVLIHDGVRPFISEVTITSLIRRLADVPAVLAGIPVVDTVKRVDDAGIIRETIPRERLWRAATPQGFHFHAILTAHAQAVAEGNAHGFTDDAAVMEWAGVDVTMVEGNADNLKLTTPADFAAVEEALSLKELAPLWDIRVGTGYDVHAFDAGDHVTLCGVKIPYHKKLKGHSDADVALHAVTDAILGALGDGDIGQHFPPSDMQWRGAASEIFVADAVRRVAARGGRIAHIDVSLIAEAPKIGPHREAMRAAVAQMAGISLDRVGVKATTNEKLGFVGRGEGIAAIATVTVRLPWG